MWQMIKKRGWLFLLALVVVYLSFYATLRATKKISRHTNNGRQTAVFSNRIYKVMCYPAWVLERGLRTLFVKSTKRHGQEGEIYAYYFQESTGPNQWASKDGKKTLIKFASDSNQKAVQALRTLRWQVLYLNSNGQIQLIGTLHDEPRCADWEGKDLEKKPLDQNATCPFVYHFFTLSHWQIKTPFRMYEIGKVSLDETPPEIQVDSLKPEYFDAKIEDIRSYQISR